MVDIHSIREEVFNSVSHLSDEQLNQKVDKDTWSIMQVLEHLYLMEKSVVGRMKAGLLGESVEVEEKPVELVQNRAKRIEAPDFLIPIRDNMSFQEVKKLLAESRTELDQFIATTSDKDLVKKSFPHRLFGSLSLQQGIQLIGFHEKRHIEQIEEVKERLAFK